MKTLIIYTSQTGFTKKYAEWLAEKMSGDLLELKDARKKTAEYFEDYDAICYGGWIMAENIVKVKWFLENPDIDIFLKKALTEDQKMHVRLFYCQGGFNYEKMNGPSRIAMKMFVSTLKKKERSD